MSCLVGCCVEVCCRTAAGAAGRDSPPCVSGLIALAISITLLVIGILGSRSVIQMEPAAAYCGFMVPSAILFLLSFVFCCKDPR